MQFTKTILVAAAVLASTAIAQQNTVLFQNVDSTPKTIKFTAGAGSEPIEPLYIDGLASESQTFPHHWGGNWYSFSEGAQDIPGMLGEAQFQGWNSRTYFDVSSIVNQDDTQGVKILYPQSGDYKVDVAQASGCLESIANSYGKTTGCHHQYNVPDDVATMSTALTSLICVIGTPTPIVRRRKVEMFSRDYVTGVISQ